MSTILLSQDEINLNAVKFSERWKNEKSEKSEAQTFVNEFFAVFGLDRKSVAKLEDHPDTSKDFMDCFWKGKFMIEMKSLGENLDEAMDQALDYYVDLKKENEPQYILVCDFKHWYLRDKNENTDHFFDLADLVSNIGLFGFMTDRPKLVPADPVNLQATDILSKIFEMLKEAGYGTHDATYFLTRLVFCLFADDTGIFGDYGKFQAYIKRETKEDGTDLGRCLADLFEILNQDRESRSKFLDPKTRSFPYINGSLFEKQIKFPYFNTEMRALLIQAGDYDWKRVSPAIFGNMFQTVMDQDARHEVGAHYTSEENILRVIRPLFLDKLNEEFNEINKIMDAEAKKEGFIEFQNKLSNLKFLDPACGSGNFLIVAYREIRRLEHRAIMKIYGYKGERIDTDELSKVDVNQFYGIEMLEFPSRIAETSLWMMDHIMNVELSKRYGLRFRRIPIKKKPSIVNRDALEFDWNELLPATECDYVFGNPPFSGSKQMTDEQKEQTIRITKSKGLDYVSNWFVKAVEYIPTHTHTHTHTGSSLPTYNPEIAFVSTNSITQGSQPKSLFPQLFDKCVKIQFAYTSFPWISEAKGKALVSVIIIGLSKNKDLKKRLFDYVNNNIVESNPKEITAYLRKSNIQQTIVSGSSKLLNGLPHAHVGSNPKDDGHYIFNESEYLEFIKLEPEAEKWIFPYSSGADFLHNKKRYVLALRGIKPHELNKLPKTMQRVEKVREFRLSAKSKMTQKKAETSVNFIQTNIPTRPFLTIPMVSSEKRKYVPMDFMKPPTIPSILLYYIEDASVELFGLLESHMHMVWVRSVGGKLGTGFRYSANIVYNTFPIPKDYSSLKPYAQEILDVRKKYPESTLAELYGRTTMPDDLLKAHQTLDKKVEKLYRDEPFESDEERLEFLLEEYGKMVPKQTTLKPEPKK